MFQSFGLEHAGASCPGLPRHVTTGTRDMYTVALCEDEQAFADQQESMVRGILDQRGIRHRVDVFRDARDFMAAFSKMGRRWDLILLDIVLNDSSGMELAKTIRASDRAAAIVFVTSHREYALEGYDVGALHYLLKPVDPAALDRLIAEVHRKRQPCCIMRKSGGGERRVPLRDIVSLETKGRYLEITLMDEAFRISGKLADWLAILPEDGFVRCHQSFAVNIANIRELARFHAIASNGKKIPVSRARLKAIQKTFLADMTGTA